VNFNRKTFWENYRAEFGRVTQKQVKAVEFLLDRFESDGWKDIRLIAYCFSTIKHETANTFEPIYERGAKSYFDKYEGRKSLGNTQKGDGYKFRGRGFVQITGRANHIKLGKIIGADLVSNPNLALKPEIAFEILVVGMLRGLFTGKKLSDYINSEKTDYKSARRIVNGTDKDILIASIAVKFESILKNSIAQRSEAVATAGSTKPQGVAVESPGNDSSVSPALNSESDGGQVADQITNINSGEKAVPDNFVPDTKTMDAPPKAGVSEKLGRWAAYLGLGVPSVAGIGQATKQLYDDGTISPADIFRVIAAVFNLVLPYSVYIIFGFIGYKIIKEGLKQISFMLRMWLNASPSHHDVQISVKEVMPQQTEKGIFSFTQ